MFLSLYFYRFCAAVHLCAAVKDSRRDGSRGFGLPCSGTLAARCSHGMRRSLVPSPPTPLRTLHVAHAVTAHCAAHWACLAVLSGFITHDPGRDTVKDKATRAQRQQERWRGRYGNNSSSSSGGKKRKGKQRQGYSSSAQCSSWQACAAGWAHAARNTASEAALAAGAVAEVAGRCTRGTRQALAL